MGGSLKFPSRKKYRPEDRAIEHVEEKPVSPEEHDQRMQKLKELGLIR